jgi:arylsulfatase A-like enzyme
MKRFPYQIRDLLIILVASQIFYSCESPPQESRNQPNIVWLVTEDNSKHYLKLYDEGGASMPHIEKLARQGIVFDRAFSQAPVCSVARSTIISGCHAPRIGAQYHRRSQLAPMPDGLEMFPYYLRQAGYYTSNNYKEDYNLIKSDEVWDESSKKASYRNRKPGQAFFHVQNFDITHEGKLHFGAKKMHTISTLADPAEVVPFPYHPNTLSFRYTYAQYLDLHQQADKAIGQFLQQLEEEGLMEDTFIFYYGDHGGVLPRSKGYIYESGVHVPLVVYVPEKWKHLVPFTPGSRTNAFVQFADLAPTILQLASAEIPHQMDGKAFLGPGISKQALEQRNTTFSYADRFDEKYDLVRAIRKGKYKYIRSYQPFNIDALFNFYRYKMLAYKEWAQLFEAGQLNDLQRQFFQARSPEALYDLEKDPHEINNLAEDPAYQSLLEALRADLQQQLRSMPDLSFYPEPYFLEAAISNPVQFGQDHKKEISDLIAVADLSLLPFSKAQQEIKAALVSDNPWIRYWGLIVCSTFGKKAAVFYEKAKEIAKKDQENLVRIRALEFLALNDQSVDANLIRSILQQAKSKTEANLMLNSVALLKTVKTQFQIEIPKNLFPPEWVKKEQDWVSRRVEFINQFNK